MADDLLDELDDEVVEPREHDRVYYRSLRDGSLGYMVKMGHRDMIKLDKPGEEVLFEPGLDWQPEEPPRCDVNRMQAAEVAWQADKSLKRWLGDKWDPRTEWLNTHEEERIRFAKEGPMAGGLRDKVFDAIMRAIGC